MLSNLVALIAIISLFNATVIITLHKWNWFEWYEARKPKWLKWFKQCVFCFGFRLAIFEIILIAFIMPSWYLIIVPYCCASLTYLIVAK